MKIAIAQIDTTVGDILGNSAKIKDCIQKGAALGADIVVFPEMAVTSYPARDLLEKKHFVKDNLSALKDIARSCKKTAAIIGFISINDKKHGKGLYNSAALLKDGRVSFVQHKSLLPTYDVFDEARHFEPAVSHKAVSFKGTKIGITICEDVWSAVDIGGRRLYHVDPVKELVKNGAKLIINISASPFNVGKISIREGLLKKIAKAHQVPIVYVNAVGGNDELVFDGRSIVVDKNARIVHICKAFEEDLHIIDTEALPKKEYERAKNDIAELHDALVLGLKDYFRKCGFKKAIVGLSGGIDSCIVASIAAEALGAGNVTGITMPSPYSSSGSVNDAERLAKNLNIKFQNIPIGDIYNEYLKTLKAGTSSITLTEENIQARIRGNILMAESNRTGGIVLSTGNKSELAVGYCTLYGDMAGGLALISDVPKTMVYELARYINRSKVLIPVESITKPPSAELRPDQKDSDSLPPYDILDEILKLYIEEHKSLEEIVRKGFDRPVVKDVLTKVDRNEYKRRQAAPGFKVTSKAFGAGRIYPIACRCG